MILKDRTENYKNTKQLKTQTSEYIYSPLIMNADLTISERRKISIKKKKENENERE